MTGEKVKKYLIKKQTKTSRKREKEEWPGEEGHEKD